MSRVPAARVISSAQGRRRHFSARSTTMTMRMLVDPDSVVAQLTDRLRTMTESSHATAMPGNELRSAFRACTGALMGVGIFSGVVNMLGLTGSLYMLQVYDRVL